MKVGDVVRVKSGGIRMTIEEIGQGYADCVWMDGANAVRGSFSLETLELA